MEPSTRRWTRAEYDALVDKGILGPDDRIELLGGALVVREPQHAPHAVATGLVEDALRAAFGPGWLARGAKPIALDDESEPEPDVAIVPGPHRQYLSEHPARPVLVVEVAESSLVRDRTYKASLYARAAIADCWIVNLVDRLLDVHRDPRPDPAARFGWGYASITRLGDSDTVSPLSAPAARILVADLLP